MMGWVVPSFENETRLVEKTNGDEREGSIVTVASAHWQHRCLEVDIA